MLTGRGSGNSVFVDSRLARGEPPAPRTDRVFSLRKPFHQEARESQAAPLKWGKSSSSERQGWRPAEGLALRRGWWGRRRAAGPGSSSGGGEGSFVGTEQLKELD